MFRGPRYYLEMFLVSIILGKPDKRHFKAFYKLVWEDIKVLLYTGYTVEEIIKRNK
jgi:hypothetical protein